jgi:hypothetical protein
MKKMYPMPTAKQTFVILALIVVLWIPMTFFMINFVGKISNRQIGIIGLINLLVANAILVWSFRTWIQKVK